MEINKELVLSTCHIPEVVAEQLANNTIEGLIVIRDEYSWRVLTDIRTELSLDPQGESAIPSVLLHLLGLAQGLDCKWLLLDQDGPVDDSLAIFDW